MKCEKCHRDYTSGYYFKTETVCIECFHTLNPKEQKDAVVGIRYDATEVTDGVTEVLCYGTAVIVEPE
jgi:uncharacterized Zn ribbon protein